MILNNFKDTISSMYKIVDDLSPVHERFISFMDDMPGYRPFSMEKVFLLHGSGICHIEVDPTDNCYVGCDKCSFKHVRNRSNLDIAFLQQLCTGIKEKTHLLSVTFSGGGDPLVAPHINEITEAVAGYTDQLAMITSGFTDDRNHPEFKINRCADILVSRMKMIRFSLDRTLRSDKYKLNTTVNNINTLKDIIKGNGDECSLSIGALIDFRSDAFYNEADEIASIANRLELPLMIRPAFDFIPEPTVHDFTDVERKTEYLYNIIGKDIPVSYKEALERVLFVGAGWKNKSECRLIMSGLYAKVRADGKIFQCVQHATQEKSFSPHEIGIYTRQPDDIGHEYSKEIPVDRCIYCRESSLNLRWELLDRGYRLSDAYRDELVRTYGNGNNMGYFW